MPLTPSDVPAHIATEFQPPHDFVKNGATIPELYDWHATANPNYPLFTYRDGAKSEYITYSTANWAINRAASYVATGLDRQAPETGSRLPVIAVFANADTITYFCVTLGILRAGCTAFLISTRNGPAGVADMLQRTGAAHLIVSRDATLRSVAEEALSNLPSGQVKIRDMPIFEDLFPQGTEKAADSPYTSMTSFPKTYTPDSPAVILHSSGSTGHPKPIPWAHKHLGLWGRLPMASEVDTTRSIMGCHGTPMFHGLGAFMYSASPLCGYIVAVLKPATPPIFPTPDAVWEGIVATKSDFTWSVPSFIEEWARDPEKVIHMKQMRGVIFGGAPLNQAVGDALASRGVKLFTVYGLTEVGCISTFVRADPGMDWSYFALNQVVTCKFVPHDDNKFEIVVVSPPDIPLPATNTEVDGRGAYATNDLVEPHPTKPGLWRIYGRADEQIMLSNGEKTNPLPLERIINEDPAVKCSVMFGRGKFQNGVLVEPAEDLKIDPSDTKQVEAFRNKIWPTIERVNEYAPRHSRIFKEMILVTSPSKPFQFNVKGLPRRSIILGQYNDEIEALYKRIEESAQNELHPPAEWDEQSTRSFVRSVVEHTLRRPVADDADIFRNGGDSLQATWIRNTILRAVRETEPGAVKRLPANLVFQAPTIAALANTVYAAISSPEAGSSPSYTANDLWKYVEKYSASLPARPTALVDRPENGKDVVLITGTTGGFGCDALEHLLREERVERVYAFNRKGSDALIRQRAQFRARGLDESLLDTPKFQMVEAVLHEPDFGVEPELLDEIRQSVTHILHNAWRVNFSLSLPSFEVDIQGARNLVDLAISSPFSKAPSVLFVSSVGVFMGYDGPAPAPEAPLNDSKTAYGTGYAESKWVTEHVLENVTKKVGIHTVVMRLGQVTGNKVGYWNEREWFPALVKTAQFQRCLPDIEGTVTWIPGYEASKAFTEMRHSPEPYLHLVHPRPVPWHDLITPIAEELGVPLVPYEKWVSALQESAKEGDASEVDLMKANPALRLLSFFKGLKSAPDHEPLGIVYLSTEKATKVSEALANLPQLSTEYAKGWVAAWKRAGFL